MGVGLVCVHRYKMDFADCLAGHQTLTPVAHEVRNFFCSLNELPGRAKEISEFLEGLETLEKQGNLMFQSLTLF